MCISLCYNAGIVCLFTVCWYLCCWISVFLIDCLELLWLYDASVLLLLLADGLECWGFGCWLYFELRPSLFPDGVFCLVAALVERDTTY